MKTNTVLSHLSNIGNLSTDSDMITSDKYKACMLEHIINIL